MQISDQYFAGLFDGEGTLRISFNRTQYQLFISLGMTDEVPVQALKERFGGWVELRSNSHNPNWSPVWIWRGSSKAAICFLDATEQFLITKAPQAKLAREFQALLKPRTARITDEKHSIYLKMKEANRRGPAASAEVPKTT